MLAAIIILFAWGGYGIAIYLLLYVIDCGVRNVKLDNTYIIRLIAISVVLMVLMSACTATTGRAKYVSFGRTSGYDRPFSVQSGGNWIDSFYRGFVYSRKGNA